MAFHADFPTMKALQNAWLKHVGKKYAKDRKDWSAATLVGLAGTHFNFKHTEAAVKYARKD